MEAAGLSEKLHVNQRTWCHIPEECYLNIQQSYISHIDCRCEIWGFCSGVTEDAGHLRYDTLLLGEWFSLFHSIMCTWNVGSYLPNNTALHLSTLASLDCRFVRMGCWEEKFAGVTGSDRRMEKIVWGAALLFEIFADIFRMGQAGHVMCMEYIRNV